MKILAFDISTVSSGWGVIDISATKKKARLIACGEIALNRMIRGSERMLMLFNSVRTIYETYAPDRVAIEEIFRGPSTITFKRLAEFRGVAVLAFATLGIFEYDTFTAAQARSAVFGDGRMKKDEVCAVLSKYFGSDLKTLGYDQSDALAVALACARVCIPLPKKKR